MAEAAHSLDPADVIFVDTSHLVTEDDEPLDNPFQERQQRLLVDSLYASWSGCDNFVALANVGVFGSIHRPAIVPDVLLALHVQLRPVKDTRAYFVWEYGKPPDLVVEIVSKEPGGEDTRKVDKFAALGVGYYVIYNPFLYRGDRVLKAYQRHGLNYIDIANPSRIPELGLGLVTWTGSYQGCEGTYLRFVDSAGQLLLTGEERAEEEKARADEATARADEEKARANEEKARADEEKARADEATVRVAEANERAAKLAERLRELGLDPTTL